MNDSKEVIMGDPDLFRISQIKNKEVLNRILNGEYFSNKGSSYSAFYSESLENKKTNQLDFMFRRTKSEENVLEKKKKEIEMQDEQIYWNMNQLKIKLKKDRSSRNKIKQWFNQAIFQKIKKKDNSKDKNSEEIKENDSKKHSSHLRNIKTFPIIKLKSLKSKLKYKKKDNTQTVFKILKKEKKITGIFNFEEVDLKKFDNENSDSIVEVLNLAKQMLNKKRSQKLINSSFNRYFYDNTSDISEYLKRIYSLNFEI